MSVLNSPQICTNQKHTFFFQIFTQWHMILWRQFFSGWWLVNTTANDDWSLSKKILNSKSEFDNDHYLNTFLHYNWIIKKNRLSMNMLKELKLLQCDTYCCCPMGLHSVFFYRYGPMFILSNLTWTHCTKAHVFVFVIKQIHSEMQRYSKIRFLDFFWEEQKIFEMVFGVETGAMA